MMKKVQAGQPRSLLGETKCLRLAPLRSAKVAIRRRLRRSRLT